MPWSKLDDNFYDHPKVMALTPRSRLACVGLWTLMLSYAGRQLSDGFIPSSMVRQLGGNAGLIGELIRVGLVEVVEGGYLLHDYLDYNKSRERVVAERRNKAEAGRLGGLARGSNPKQDESTPSSSRLLAASSSSRASGDMPPSLPDHARPDPVPRGTSQTDDHEAMFEGWLEPAWDPFKAAWRARGFHLPPTTPQREVLWPIADARPTDLATWVTEAPLGMKAGAVIGLVLQKWDAFRESRQGRSTN